MNRRGDVPKISEKRAAAILSLLTSRLEESNIPETIAEMVSDKDEEVSPEEVIAALRLAPEALTLRAQFGESGELRWVSLRN